MFCVCAKVVFVPGVLGGVQVVNCEISSLQCPHRRVRLRLRRRPHAQVRNLQARYIFLAEVTGWGAQEGCGDWSGTESLGYGPGEAVTMSELQDLSSLCREVVFIVLGIGVTG